MRNYLVTGGAGFLGSHLCERLMLLDETCKVVAVDNLSSSDGSNLTKLRGPEYRRQFRFLHRDVCEPYTWSELDEFSKSWDGVFNLACPASPPFYQNMPIETTLTSVLGARHALEFATRWECKILQTSTSEVYGDPEVHPQPESYRGKVNCFGPRACYDEGKRAAESLFFDYQKQRGTDIRVVRIFNTYGPHMLRNDGRVVTNFISQALLGEPITIYGDGQQSRSFCYVSDLIDALLVVWNSNYKSPVNIGNPCEHTMLNLAKLLIHLTNSKSEISYMPLPTDDPTQRCPDITLAKSLGWAGPKIPLDEGLLSTIQYFLYKSLTAQQAKI
jgi:UDP-glucuronate decarboxylase